MKRILTAASVLLILAACSNSPTGIENPVADGPDKIISLSYGPDISDILAAGPGEEMVDEIAEAWRAQLTDDLYSSVEIDADRILAERPDLVEIRQTRLIPVVTDPKFLAFAETGACVEFGCVLQRTLELKGLVYEITEQVTLADQEVILDLDGIGVVPLRMLVCQVAMPRQDFNTDFIP